MTADTLYVTDEDRKRWPYMGDDTVRAHKWVHQQPDDRLRAAITYEPDGSVDWSNPVLIEINSEAGASVNWTIGTIAEAMYEKGLIDERELDRITE